MKKRMRKKKHVGEFTEWGRQIIIYRNCSDHFDKFLDAFIEEAVEANDCRELFHGCKVELMSKAGKSVKNSTCGTTFTKIGFVN